jgi:hypothetical protein
MVEAEAVEWLLPIPSIGPFSAAIVRAVGAGCGDVFHVDSFTRPIMREFYFDGRAAGDDELRAPRAGHVGAARRLGRPSAHNKRGAVGRPARPPAFRRSGAHRGRRAWRSISGLGRLVAWPERDEIRLVTLVGSHVNPGRELGGRAGTGWSPKGVPPRAFLARGCGDGFPAMPDREVAVDPDAGGGSAIPVLQLLQCRLLLRQSG